MKLSKTVEILGVRIHAHSKKDVLTYITQALSKKERLFIATPNPEMCVKAAEKYDFKEVLNNATIRIPDGGGLQWAAAFLKNKHGLRNAKYVNIPIMFIDWLATATRFTFSKNYKASVIPEPVRGIELMMDLADFAHKNNKSLFLLGAKEGIAKKAAAVLQKKYPGIKIAGTYSGDPSHYSDVKTQKIINDTKADFLFVAFGAPKQEYWIHRNFPGLRAQLAMGVGGAFDFISGEVERAPDSYKHKSIEWLWRLRIEPWRKERIKNAVIRFPFLVYLSKIYAYRPYRPNVLCLILDKDEKCLILNNSYIYKKSGDNSHWQLLQGGKRPYESTKRAAFRESKEEMGSSQLELIRVAKQTYSYEWPLKTYGIIEGFRLKRPYKGQKQEIALLRYTGDHSDVKIDPKEHSDYKWVKKSELLKSLHPIRRKVAQIALNELEKSASKNHEN